MTRLTLSIARTVRLTVSLDPRNGRAPVTRASQTGR